MALLLCPVLLLLTANGNSGCRGWGQLSQCYCLGAAGAIACLCQTGIDLVCLTGMPSWKPHRNYAGLQPLQLQLCHTCPLAPSVVDDEGNRKIARAVLRHNGRALQFMSAALRDDREMVLEAIRQNWFAYTYASLKLRHEPEIILAMIGQHRRALEYVPCDFQGDRNVVMAAVGLASGCP